MAVASASIPAEDLRQSILRIDGMTCGHCSATVSRELLAVPGVVSAETNHASGTSQVTHKPTVSSAALHGAVERAGYRILGATEAAERPAVRERTKARQELRLFFWSLAWTLPVLVIHYGGFMDHDGHAGGTPLAAWIVFGCATVLQPTSAFAFYRGAFRALKRGAADMDVLVSAGIAAGYAYAALSVFFPASFPGNSMEFFEAATLLICFIRFGKWMEASSRASAAEAMSELLQITPSTVHKVGPDGSETIVPATSLQVGDFFAVRPGDVFAVDGKITEGTTSVDESVVSGESDPVTKATGDRVIAGSANLSDRVVVRATRVGNDTTVARIVSMVEQAQVEKAPIQRTADKIAAIFVPVVVVIAIGSGIAWALAGEGVARVLTHVIGVLVIACPCALGLAVPAAIMIGCAAGMRKGILVRNGAALEEAGRLTMVVFDKTGTLTEGRPRITNAEAFNGHQLSAIAQLLRPARFASSHPASLAASRWATETAGDSQPAPTLASSKEIPGQGVEYSTNGSVVRVGRLEFADPGFSPPVAGGDATTDSGSRLWVSVNGRMAASLDYADPLRPESAEVVRKLKAAGLRVVLLSGDREPAVAAIAREAGIDTHFSGATPESKLARIREWQAAGERVGMVGDGINDAPALAQADLGIVMGGGAGISQSAGEIILGGHGLTGLPRMLELSAKVRRGIRGNLAASLVYNLIGIPLAAGVAALVWDGAVIPPSYAALAMVLSDISVAGNSWLLARRLRPV